MTIGEEVIVYVWEKLTHRYHSSPYSLMAATTAMKPLSEALAIEQIDQGSFRTFAHSDYCYGDCKSFRHDSSLV